MGLEVASTIDQLNANWPLGTDPKSRGDDHLRLIKAVLVADVPSLSRATVQAFAGPLSVGGNVSITGQFRAFGADRAAEPGYAWTNGLDMGMYRAGAASIGFAVAGEGKGFVNVDGFFAPAGAKYVGDGSGLTNLPGSALATPILLAADGAVGAPVLSWAADPDTGIYRNGVDAFAFAAGGVLTAFVTAEGLAVASGRRFSGSGAGLTDIPAGGLAGDIGAGKLAMPIRLPSDGSAALPVLSWAADPDTGIYRNGADAFAFATAGVLRARVGIGGFTVAAGMSFNGSGAGLTDIPAGALPTSAAETTRINANLANSTIGSVGTLAFLRHTGTGGVGPGAFVPGPELVWANASGSGGSTTVSGTWRCLGSIESGASALSARTTLFFRSAETELEEAEIAHHGEL